MWDRRSLRTLLKAVVYLALGLIALALLFHASPMKELARRFAVDALQDRLGGSASVERLDYRLWRGEVQAFGLQWSSADDSVVLRAPEVAIDVSWATRTLSVVVRSPDVRLREVDSGVDDADVFELPAWLFGNSVTVTGARLRYLTRDNEAIVALEELDARLAPGESSQWEGNVSLARGRLRWDERELELGPVRADLGLTSSAADIDGARIEIGDSSVTGAVRVESFSPFIVETDVAYSIESALIETLAPELSPMLTIAGPIVGDTKLRLESGEWRGHGELQAPGVAYAPVEPIDVRAPWRLEGDALFVEGAELRGYGGQATANATLDLASSSQELEVTFRDIEAHPGLASRVTGTASVSSRGWDVLEGSGEARIELRPMTAREGIPLGGNLRARLAGGKVRVDARRLSGPGFEAEVSGDIGDTLSLNYVARLTEMPDGISGTVRAAGAIEGSLANPRATADVASEELVVSRIPVDVDGQLVWSGREVAIPSLTVEHASGGRLALRGSYDLDSEYVTLRGEGDAFEVTEVPELTARISSIRLELAGPIAALAGSASAEVDGLSYRGVALPSARVSVDADGNGARFEARTSGRPLVSGQVAFREPYPAELEASLDPFPLGALLKSFEGFEESELQVRGRVVGNAPIDDLSSFTYLVEVDEVVGSYRGVGFGVSSPFIVEGDADAARIDDLTLVGVDTAIGVEGRLPLSPSGTLDLRARGVARLELLSLWLPGAQLAGQADLEIFAQGRVRDPDLRGDVRISQGGAQVGALRVDGVEAHARFLEDIVVLESLDGDVLGGNLHIEGDLPSRWEADGTARLRFRVDDIDPSLLDPEGEYGLDASEFRLSVSGELYGPARAPARWGGSGRIEQLRARVGTAALASEGAAPWTLGDGRFALSELHMRGDDTDFTVEAEARPWAAPLEWSGRASGRIDSRFVAPVLADLGMSLTGATTFGVSARQGAEPLVVEGKASIRNARLAIREPALAFTNLTGDIELASDSVKLTRFDASVGGGRFAAEGEVRLSGASIEEVNLVGRADSVRLSYPEGLRSEIDGTIRLTGSPPALRVSGDIELERAIFSRNINLETELLQSLSRATALPPAESFASRTRLDVRIRTREGLRVDNNLATMEASSSLTLTGTLAEPELGGIVTIREGGQFRFGRNRFRIESGRIALQRYPAEPPELDIAARTSVGGNDIRFRVRGTTDDLTTELSGTTPAGEALSRADATSLLLTGRTIDRVSSEGRTILGEQAATYLGASLANLAQLGLGGALPFDIITVEPALIARETDPSARFTLGAALTESLSVVYSIGLNDAERQIWIVDYQLPRRLRTQLIRQEDNDFTFALGQQVRFSWHERSRDEREVPPDVSRVDFYFVTGEPGDLEGDARKRLGLEVGERYDYWKAWERAERLRDWLRDRGFLEATADLIATPCGTGCIEVDFFVVTGKRVRFVWEGDELEDSVQDMLTAEWDGYMTAAFLASDLEAIAEGELFRRRYYTASVDVEVEETIAEIVVTVRVDRGPRGTRVGVDFVGNEALSDSALLEALPRRSTPAFHELITFKRPRLKQILEVRYAGRGYLQASIGDPTTSFDADSGALQVTIPVTEAEPSSVGGIDFHGVERLDESAIRSLLTLREGAPFRLDQFVQDRAAIAAFYRRQGFPDVEVDSAIVPGDDPRTLVARFEVREGPGVTVGDIEIAGNAGTRENVIRREVVLKPGDPLLQSDISTTQKRLYELGIFRSADVVVSEVESGADTTRRDVVVEVAETPDLTLDYGLRYSTDGRFQVFADVVAPNMFGRAERLSFRPIVGTDERIFRLSYRMPYIVRYKLETDFFIERAIEEMTPESIEALPFTDRSWTFTGQQSRPLTEKLGLQWSYSFKRTSTELDDPFLGPFIVDQKRSIFSTALINDDRDNVVNPSRGSLWSVTAQGAPQFFASDFKFVKIFAQAYTFVPLGDGVVWAAGYRAGAINSFGQLIDDDDLLFQAGGPNSVRGFEQASLGPPLGGEGVLIFNQEIRFPIVWRVRGAGFYDAGNAFASASEIKLSELRHSAGVGLRFELPFGLIRFDWARLLDRRNGEDAGRFIISLGNAF